MNFHVIAVSWFPSALFSSRSSSIALRLKRDVERKIVFAKYRKSSFLISILHCHMPPNIQIGLDKKILQNKIQQVMTLGKKYRIKSMEVDYSSSHDLVTDVNK